MLFAQNNLGVLHKKVAVSNNGYRLALVDEVVAEAHKRSVLVSDNLTLEQQLCLVYTTSINVP
jgi:hypothetical protein